MSNWLRGALHRLAHRLGLNGIEVVHVEEHGHVYVAARCRACGELSPERAHSWATCGCDRAFVSWREP